MSESTFQLLMLADLGADEQEVEQRMQLGKIVQQWWRIYHSKRSSNCDWVSLLWSMYLLALGDLPTWNSRDKTGLATGNCKILSSSSVYFFILFFLFAYFEQFCDLLVVLETTYTLRECEDQHCWGAFLYEATWLWTISFNNFQCNSYHQSALFSDRACPCIWSSSYFDQVLVFGCQSLCLGSLAFTIWWLWLKFRGSEWFLSSFCANSVTYGLEREQRLETATFAAEF